MLPLADGPLVDAGIANGLATDDGAWREPSREARRGWRRPDGTDIGAVELPDEELIDPVRRRQEKAEGQGQEDQDRARGRERGSAGNGAASGTVKLGKKKVGLGDQMAAIPAGATPSSP